MIYITGDTHGQNDVAKLFPAHFPIGKTLTRDDYLIITGDFGGVWYGDERDDQSLAFYEEKKYTVLFVDGNHENFDTLLKYPVKIWHGGKVHMIRSNIIHLMRGQIFVIDGKSFFTFGGGISIDKHLRIPYVSWWAQEEPNNKEVNEALNNLEKNGNKVDYIITHAAPESIMRNELCQIKPMLQLDCSTEKFLNHIYNTVTFDMWFCGHYHMDTYIRNAKLQVLYDYIIKLDSRYPIVNRDFKSLR